jgi:hypothetical protein
LDSFLSFITTTCLHTAQSVCEFWWKDLFLCSCTVLILQTYRLVIFSCSQN